MNKIIKNILLSITLIILFIIPSVKANTIKSIDMDIYLDENGTAHVTEIWEANLTQGTEGYKPYNDLGISKIKNYTVSDDTGRVYEYDEAWNMNTTFAQKAYKNGINKISNGVELCFGISQYGNRTYTMKYDITDFVTQYTDVQGIYFTFIDMEQYIGKAKVTIYSDTPFSIEENVKIWGYGHEGTTTIEDGKIVIQTESIMNSYNYISGLVRFETNMFKTNKKVDYSFDEDFNEAMEVIENPDKRINSDDEHSALFYIAMIPLMLVFMLLATVFSPFAWLIIVIAIMYLFSKSDTSSSELQFDGGKKLDKVPNFREIPCNKDLFYAYFLSYHYNIAPTKTIKEGIIGAVLLKWLVEKKINIVEGKKKLFNVKDNNYVVDFNNMFEPTDELEKQVYEIFIAASGTNRLLESKEFEKWCTKNYYKLNKWYEKILKVVEEELANKNLIVKQSKEVKGLFGKVRTVTEKHVTVKVKEEAEKLLGLKQFLSEDSLIDEKKYIEVHIWNEYLMLAELMGIDDKVREQFSKLYPDVKTNPQYNIDNMTYIGNIASSAYKGYTVGINRATARSYSGGGSYSGHSSYSGGGGHSFSSGGHSSSGSHGGGFR